MTRNLSMPITNQDNVLRNHYSCLDEVTFEFNQLGFVDSGRIKLADLTMLCGPNNIGKTYLSYAIYGVLKHLSKLSSITLPKSVLDELKKTGVCSIHLETYAAKLPEILQQASAQFSKKLPNFFNVSADLFKDSSVAFHIEAVTTDFSQPFKHTVQIGTQAGPQDLLRLAKEAGETVMTVVLQSSELPASILQDLIAEQIAGILLFNRLPRPFVITSERTGIALFYKELDISKNAILEQLTEKDKVNPVELLNQLRSRYAEPIKDNIDLVRDYDTLSQRQSFIREEPIKYQAISEVLKQLVDGCFTTVNKQVMYQPAKAGERDAPQLPVYVASSSVKSLFLFDYYINCLAVPGDILIIDEPELNLHPDKQRLLASLLARLVNAGIKVLCTTHSDFLVKEINNRIMLSLLDWQKQNKLFGRGLVQEDILRPKQVNAYTVDQNHQIQEIERTKSGWLDLEMFDNLIADSNELADEIYDNLGE
jgi:energy-coupling factor transporter ATP-binding protein EcfA2